MCDGTEIRQFQFCWTEVLKENPGDHEDTKKSVDRMEMRKIVYDCVDFDEGEKHEDCELDLEK